MSKHHFPQAVLDTRKVVMREAIEIGFNARQMIDQQSLALMSTQNDVVACRRQATSISKHVDRNDQTELNRLPTLAR